MIILLYFFSLFMIAFYSSERKNTVPVTITIFILVSYCLLFQSDYSRDFSSYISWFNSIINDNQSDSVRLKDPAFYIISSIAIFFGFGVLFVSAIFSIISLKIKFKFFYFFSTSVGWCLYLYISRFFFTHEFTQFRVAAAIALSSIGVYFFIKRPVFAYLLILLSMTFHLASGIMFFCLPIISLLKRGYLYSARLPLLLIIIGGVMLFFNPIAIMFAFKSTGYLWSRISPYIDGGYLISEINVLNSYFLYKSVVLIFYLYLVYKNKICNVLDYVALYLSILGWLGYIAFRSIDAIGIRFSELFSLFDIVLFVNLLNYLNFRSKVVYKIFLVLLGSLFYFSSTKILLQ